MAEIVCDCPRCGTQHVTFEIKGESLIGRRDGWACVFEAFCVCRSCRRATIFIVEQEETGVFNGKNKSITELKGPVNPWFKAESYISLADQSTVKPPEHLPEGVKKVFEEASRCLSAGCWNAAGTMFRLAVDLSTAPLLPVEEVQGLNQRTRRDLGLRLPWLFESGRLPEDLRDLSTCIREDGNDAAHRGTLSEPEAQDLLDFTVALLERLYTMPERVKLAAERRGARRGQTG